MGFSVILIETGAYIHKLKRETMEAVKLDSIFEIK